MRIACRILLPPQISACPRVTYSDFDPQVGLAGSPGRLYHGLVRREVWHCVINGSIASITWTCGGVLADACLCLDSGYEGSDSLVSILPHAVQRGTGHHDVFLVDVQCLNRRKDLRFSLACQGAARRACQIPS